MMLTNTTLVDLQAALVSRFSKFTLKHGGKDMCIVGFFNRVNLLSESYGRLIFPGSFMSFGSRMDRWARDEMFGADPDHTDNPSLEELGVVI